MVLGHMIYVYIVSLIYDILHIIFLEFLYII